MVSQFAQIYVLAVAALLSVLALFRTYQTVRKERYANLTGQYHRIAHAVRDLQTFLERNDPGARGSKKAYEAYLGTSKALTVKVLDQLSAIFSQLTGTTCRATIKLTYPIERTVKGEKKEFLYFYAYARDDASLKRLRELDNWRVENDHDGHHLNPLFASICDRTGSRMHFCSNDLKNYPEFISTSATAYRRLSSAASDAPRNWRERLFGKDWELPYRSAICCAIRQGPFAEIDGADTQIHGFLGVDSESRGVFVERWDAEIVFAVADSLFRPLDKILRAQAAAQKLDYEIRS